MSSSSSSSSAFCIPKDPSAFAVNASNATFGGSDDRLSTFEVVFYALLAAVASIVTAFGNLLVLISFRIDRQLRTVSNYYLMSLAVADLLIGFVSMPIYTVYLLLMEWPFGVVVCNLYLCFDFTMCNASVASLLIISIDRYRSVTSPLVYRAQRTPKRALVMISSAWVVSIALWSPLIVASSVTKTDKEANVCQVEFISNNAYLTFFTSIMAFFLPVTVMTILYVRIFRETKKRQRELQHLQAGGGGGGSGGGGSGGASGGGGCSGGKSDQSSPRRHRRCFNRGSSLVHRCVRGLVDSYEEGSDNHDGDSQLQQPPHHHQQQQQQPQRIDDLWETLREDKPVRTEHFPRSTSYFRVNYQAGRRGRPAESSFTSLPGSATCETGRIGRDNSD